MIRVCRFWISLSDLCLFDKEGRKLHPIKPKKYPDVGLAEFEELRNFVRRATNWKSFGGRT